MTRIGFLGPRGTFTEAALRSMPASGSAELLPYASVALVLEAVREGEIDSALVAIENSIEGGVTGTLDELASGVPLVITDEVVLRVRFALVARPGTALADIGRVAASPSVVVARSSL